VIETTAATRITPPDEPVIIRPMRGTDIEPVSKIERQSFSTAWSTQAYVTELANPAAVYLVAVLGDRVVGYGGEWVIMDEAHITTIAVLPECRGKRIGERLLNEMLHVARKKGASRATLEVRETNEVAQRLYRKYGFVRAAQRKHYYADTNEHADIMWIYNMDALDWRRLFSSYRVALGLSPS
jgi:[ribosomal protein S18]-alanine N-acetyltransferase